MLSESERIQSTGRWKMFGGRGQWRAGDDSRARAVKPFGLKLQFVGARAQDVFDASASAIRAKTCNNFE